ncbi:DMT family transporter [Vibrio salinus]|uniref:DMT family transporter n=1 Tax=Vibrio salinus TaxID=2899784 RepID=UPI001E295B8D|nr:DMT family transporter [Vibrio salinus]MCE0494734.1 DMT family transporter [Vibrio salinus]
MFSGNYIFLGIIVNFIWGSAFLIPYYFSSLDPNIIALGRYLTYGIISVFLYITKVKTRQSLTKRQWQTAFLLAFTGNVGYYLFLTTAIHLCGITISTLIVGTIPISMIIIGCFIEKPVRLNTIVFPVLLILTGLFLVNISKFSITSAPDEMNNIILGVVFAFSSLVLWTFYGVSNVTFLKKNGSITSIQWSEAIGVCCFIQSIAAIPLLLLCKPNLTSLLFESSVMYEYIFSSLFLGIVVSWLSTILWNNVSRNIPVTLLGQIIIFETLSSLFYGYLVDQALPSLIEFSSILLIISGIYMGIKIDSYNNKKLRQTNVEIVDKSI